MAMVDSLFSAVMLIVLFGSAAGNKTTLLQDDNKADPGICKTLMNGTEGYTCQEHTSTKTDGFTLSVQRIASGKSGKKSILLPDRGLRSKAVPGLCNSLMNGTQGYTCEEHTVTTNDGFLLSIQRISSGKSGEKSRTGSPVLIVHGVLMDAAIWTILPSNESLPFLLADKGFDVWLLNTRGTKHSRTNIYSTRPSKMWDWSWDALAVHDLPKTSQHILDQTNNRPHFIGHSTATLSALVGLAKYDLGEHMKSFVLLGPIAYMGRVSSPIALLTAYSRIAQTKRVFGVHRYRPLGALSRAFFRLLCKSRHIDCRRFLDLLTGHNCCISDTEMDALLRYKLQSTSTRTIDHLSQMIRTRRLEQYNFGSKTKNFYHYDKDVPEAYNLSNIPLDVPIYISHGREDKLSDGWDVTMLLSDLRNSHRNQDKLEINFIRDYAHADFIVSRTARELLYNPVIAYLQKQP